MIDTYFNVGCCAIGLFDSGVGGTTVLKKLLSVLPNEDYIYFADGANAPYGERTLDEIKNLSIKIGDFLVRDKCKIIVIACNTATAAALTAMQEKFSVPVFGIIESGARLALATTKNKNVGIFETPFTLSTNVYEKEIKKIDSSINVYQVGCKEFCPMIESVWQSHENRFDIIKKYTSEFHDKNIDTLTLGCTHYPIIKDDIAKCIDVNIIDPADCLSSEIKKYLIDNSLQNKSDKIGSVTYHTSGSVEKFKAIVGSFFNQSIENVINTRL